MEFFKYDTNDPRAEQYELLQSLMENWEDEIVEFKTASGQYSIDKIGQYFSAISNEANLMNQQYGWLVLGVSEIDKKHVVGTAFKEGPPQLLGKFKYDISKDITDGMTFMEIIELFPRNEENEPKRVLMFKVPAAIAGMPTAWKNQYFARSGESLVRLNQQKIDEIRMEERRDWSKQVIHEATIEFLDPDAIALARKNYKEKMNRDHIAEDVDSQSDEEFLTQLKLMVDGKPTYAAMILLGKESCDYVFNTPPKIMWRLYGADGADKDYAIFTVPFINVADKILGKIRNLTYRYMPNQQSLFPQETDQYDPWLLRELLNNSIAHGSYQLGGRIYINEFEDHITITNPGEFLPQSVETVLKPGYNPPFYRNQRLADGMVKFNMIDTATSGIRKVYRIQRDKYFPMPDFDLSQNGQVAVTVYGKILNEQYTYILYEHPELDLETVFLLDQVQKGLGDKLTKDAINYLRKHKLVEGRVNSLYLSAEVSKTIDASAEYIKNKAFDDQYYKDLIINYLRQYGRAQKKDFRTLLMDKLPNSLSERQKEYKIGNLLASLKRQGLIRTDSSNQQLSFWILE